MRARRNVAVVASLALLASLLTFVSVTSSPQSATAAVAGDFDPGHIIDDAVFFDGAALDATEVQSFLNSKEPSCGGPCLRTYTQTTPTMAEAPGRCLAYPGAANESAATIIAKVGQLCGVSQKALLVLLEKEQSLVSSTNASAAKFNKATGYSCPDTAACDPAFSGYFFQVYYAARQFKYYALHPTSYNHQAGRYNNIRINPNAACGTMSVWIQNAATAGLYNYTPYVPNAAALTNLYGTGDGCSSYGNRNFWRIFSDWFGSPIVGSSLVRSAANPTVYVTSGTTKYPVTTVAVMNALFPLGKVTYVAQSYLDTFTTSHDVGRVLRGEDGSIYFFDAGMKLPLTSCDIVVDYGGDCTAAGYVQLTDGQLAAFATGPAMTSVLGTAEGGRYAIDNGVKREILDTRSQTEAGYPATFNVLTENAISGLVLGDPIVRDSAYILQRGTSTYSFYGGGVEYAVSGSASALGIPTRTTGTLSAASLAKIPNSASMFSGTVTSPSYPTGQLITDAGIYLWAAGVGGYHPPASVPISDELLASYPVAGSITVGALLKTPSSPNIYVVMPTELKQIVSMRALYAMSPGGTWLTVSDKVISSAAIGYIALTPGSLVRSPANAMIYLINGVTSRVTVMDFIMTNAAGITGFEYFNEGLLAAYPTASQILGFGYRCGGNSYVAAGGSLHPIPVADLPLWPIEFIDFDTYLCGQFKIGTPAPPYLRDNAGKIYKLEGGMKRPVASMDQLAALGGTTWLNVDLKLADLIPLGAPA